MATTFSAMLDGTDGTTVNAANSGFDNLYGPWEYETTSPAEGTASAKAILTAETAALIRQHAGLNTSRYYDFCGKLSTFDGGGVLLAHTLAGSASRAQLMVNTDGTVAMRNKFTAIQTSVTALNTAQWFRIQWGINGTSMITKIWVSATLADLFNNPPTETMTKASGYTQGSWDRIRFGCDAVHTLTVQIDRVIVDDSTFPTSGGSGNAAPTANAGTDQAVASGATVTLDGTGSTDSDGTVASYAWTQTGGPTVTLSSLTVSGPTFTAPSVSADTDLTFGLRVTDNDGAQSTQDVVIVTVSPGSGTPTEDYYDLFESGTVGAAVTSWSTVGGTVLYAVPGIGDGAKSASASPSASIAQLTHLTEAGATSSYYVDWVYQTSDISTAYIIAAFLSGGSTTRADLRVNANGSLQLRNGTTAITGAGLSPSGIIQAGVPFRVAWHGNNGGSQEAKIYLGANLWGSTADYTLTGTQNTGTFDRWRVGNIGNATLTWFVDSVRADASGYPAPLVVSGDTLGSNLWVVDDDGISWVLSEVNTVESGAWT